MLNAAPTKEQVTVKRRFGLIDVDKRCCVERKDDLSNTSFRCLFTAPTVSFYR